MKVPTVRYARPETGRSSPGQGEAISKMVEARRGAADKRSSDLGLGVKSQSRPVIAGSCRNWPQSSPTRGSRRGRATDRRVRPRKRSLSCPTPNTPTPKKVGDGGPGVSLDSERGTTQTVVKAPKCWLSVKG